MNTIVKTVLLAIVLFVLVAGLFALGLVLDWVSSEDFRKALVTALASIGVVTLTAIIVQLLVGLSDKD